MTHEALLSIGLLIIVSKLVEGALGRFHLSAIVGYMATGVLLGPVVGIVEPTVELQAFLGIGGFLFFFLIGLDEIDIRGFMATIRGRFFVAATISVVASLLVSLVVTSDVFYDFGLGLKFTDALALAGILSLSSLGVVAKELSDEGRLRDPIGIQMFTTVIIAELLAMLVVGFTLGEHDHHLTLFSMVVLMGKIAAFTIVCWLLSVRVIPPTIVALQRVLNVPHLSFGLILGILFVMVIAAEEMGLHGKLGALLVGAALSGLPHQVRRDVVPGMRSVAEGLFVPLFFASAGLHLNLSFMDLPVGMIVALVTIPLAGKFAGAFIGAFLARLDRPFPLATGLMAKGVAEIALLLVLLDTGVIGNDVFSLLAIVMFIYILLTPLMIRYAMNRARPSEQMNLPEPLPPSLLRFALDHIRVNDILDRTRAYPDSALSVREFVDRWILPHQQDYVVVNRNGEFCGIVSLSMLRYLPKEAWIRTPISDVVRRSTPSARPDEFVEDVLQRMTETSLTALPVIDRNSEEFLGVVTTPDILDLITLEARGSH